MKWLVALALCLLAGAAEAAARISLKALSPDGSYAILTYNSDWVEVTLSNNGHGRALPPPLGCDWTAMAYAPLGDELAMAAFCPAPVEACRQAEALLLVAGRDRTRPRLASTDTGARWSGLYWRTDNAALAIETPLRTPVATNLSDLATPTTDCAPEPARLIQLNTVSGRKVTLDILPRGWLPKTIIAGRDTQMIAEVRVRAGTGAHVTAARTLNTICAADPLHNLCHPSGVAVELWWRGGDWHFASPPDQARAGRMVASQDLSVIGRETCQARWVEKRFRPVCVLNLTGAGRVATIAAPDGLFGDLALSASGGHLLAVSAGLGRRVRQFDLFDTATGARRSFTRLLTLAPPYEAER